MQNIQGKKCISDIIVKIINNRQQVFQCSNDESKVKGQNESTDLSWVLHDVCQGLFPWLNKEQYWHLPVFSLIYQYKLIELKSIIIQMAQNQSNNDSFSNVSVKDSSNRFPSSINQSRSSSQQKNGKWSQIQHCKYIVFMELHRDQFKSKQQRRTHKFYKNMAQFIKTRNALQCRSHHQKLQERYCYANKIILAFKQRGNMSLYGEALAQLKEFQKKKGMKPLQQDRKKQQHQSAPSLSIQTQSQTDIFGVNKQYLYVNPAQNFNSMSELSPFYSSYNSSQHLSTTYLMPYESLFYPYYQFPQRSNNSF